MRWSALLAPLFFAAGAAAIGLAVAEGTARAALVVVIPVVYGSSLLFVLGIGLVVAGMFALPLSLPLEPEPEPTPQGAGAPRAAAGGFVLVGPVPIFWGSAAGVSRRVRIAIAVAGAIVLGLAVLVFLGWLG